VSVVPRLASRLRRVVSLLGGGGRGWALVAIASGWFLVLGLRFVVPGLLPVITDEFPVSNATAGVAITLLWAAYGAMQFPAGALVDRLGERTLLTASTAGAALAMVGFALAPTFGLFLVATLAFGATSGLFGPPRGTALTRLYDAGDGAAFGTVLAMGSVGSALLPPLALLFTGVVGWRGALGLAAPLFVLVAVGLWLAVPARGTAAAERAVRARTDGGAGPSPGGTASGPGDSGTGADPDERDETADLRERAATVGRAMRSRRVVVAVVGTTLMLFVFQGLTAFFTTYLVEQKNLAESTAGAVFGLLFLGGAVSQGSGGALARRYGHGRILAVVAFTGVLPLAVLPFVGGLVPVSLVAVLLGVRLSVGPVANSYVVALLPPAVRGTAWGAIRTAFFTVGAFGSTVVGAMADRGLFAEAFLLLAALSALAGVAYLFVPARDAD